MTHLKSFLWRCPILIINSRLLNILSLVSCAWWVYCWVGLNFVARFKRLRCCSEPSSLSLTSKHRFNMLLCLVVVNSVAAFFSLLPVLETATTRCCYQALLDQQQPHCIPLSSMVNLAALPVKYTKQQPVGSELLVAWRCRYSNNKFQRYNSIHCNKTLSCSYIHVCAAYMEKC